MNLFIGFLLLICAVFIILSVFVLNLELTKSGSLWNQIQNLNVVLSKSNDNNITNDEMKAHSDALLKFYNTFECKNLISIDQCENSGNARTCRTIFILPNGLAINKNYKLNKVQLANFWNDDVVSNDAFKPAPFGEDTCTKHPAVRLDLFGRLGNEENLSKYPQYTICGCKIHEHLLKTPYPLPQQYSDDRLFTQQPITLILGDGGTNNEVSLGISKLIQPILGVPPLVLDVTSNPPGTNYHLNVNGELILSNPCSGLRNGNYPIDNVQVKRRDVNNMRTRQPHLFEMSMALRKQVSRITCIDQQVLGLEVN